MWCHCLRCNIIFCVFEIQGSKKICWRGADFLVYNADSCRKHCSCSCTRCLLLLVCTAWGAKCSWLVFLLKSLFGKSVHCDCSLSMWTCTGLILVYVMRIWQLWNSNPWVDTHLFPYVLHHPLKLFLAQCCLHCVGQLEKNSHILREQRGLRSFASDVFWDSACFEAKLKSSTAVSLSKAVSFFYSSGFQLCIICSYLTTGVKEVEEDFWCPEARVT